MITMLAYATALLFETSITPPPPPHDDIFMAAFIFQFDIPYKKNIYLENTHFIYKVLFVSKFIASNISYLDFYF